MLRFFYEIDFRDYKLEGKELECRALVEGTQEYLWDRVGVVSSNHPNAQFNITSTSDPRRARAIVSLKSKDGRGEGLDCAFLDFLDAVGLPEGVLTSVDDPILTNALWNRGVEVEIDNLAGTTYWKLVLPK
jgi:hypothetical protein